ncbi:MAG: response regulator transcription factor [Helicobacteraceae bacterium]|jgi:two-component system OmpR family response regulator|nr:response regulator transcription factor [Helicobacteraceae bacterium]
MKHIVIAMNEESYAKSLEKSLLASGEYKTMIAKSLEEYEKLSASGVEIDCVIADYKIAERDLEKLAVKVKRQGKNASLIVISDDRGKHTLINSLNRGADDYCAVDFTANGVEKKDLMLLVARMEARLRSGCTNILYMEDLVIDPDEEKLFFKEKEVELKGKPFEVMTYLARVRGQIVSKEVLLDSIWEEPELVTPNVIEVAINQIRQKVDKPLGINTIETVRRRGYRFCYPNCSGQTITDM